MPESQWITQALEEVAAHRDALYRQMISAPPTDREWDQFRKLVELVHALRGYDDWVRVETDTTLDVPAPSEGAATPDACPAVELAGEEPPAPRVLEGTFHRRLYGGVLVTPDGEIPVFESQVRAAGLEHLDRAQATRDGRYGNGSARYVFTVVEQVGAPMPDRKQGVGTLRVGETCEVRLVDFVVRIGPNEVERMGLSDGAVVTVAYMGSEVRGGQVFGMIDRVHPTEQDGMLPVRVVGRRPQGTTPEPLGCSEEPLATGPRFRGNPRILVVGGRNWPHIRDGLIRMGAEPEWLEGFRQEGNLDTISRPYQIIICHKTNSSHGQHGILKDLAKAADKLFIATDKENWSGLRSLLERRYVPLWNERWAAQAM